MSEKINFKYKNKGEPEKSDLEWMQEFHDFLMGNAPKEITLEASSQPKLSAKKAFSIIWYLQEHFRVLPSHYDSCSQCGIIYDTDCEGHYDEKTGKAFCDHHLSWASKRIKHDAGLIGY